MSTRRLFGRDRELATFGRAISRGLSGDGAVILVRGEAGIGKSALLTAGLEAAVSTGAVALSANAVPLTGTAIGPLAELAVAAVATGARPDHPSIDLFRRSLRNLLAGSDTTDAGPLPGEPDLLGPFAAGTGEALLRLAATLPAPAVLAVEDLHWAAADTLAALEFVATSVHGRPIALVLTVRAGETGSVDALTVRLGRHSWSTVLDLGPLDRSDCVAMVTGTLGDDAGREAIGRAVDFSEGVPLLLEEFLSWAADPAEPLPHAPESFRESVWSRLDRLGIDGRRMLQGGALLGRRFDVRPVAAALGLEPEAMESSIRQAITRRLVVAVQQPDRVEFRHWLVRDAVDESLVPPYRSRLASALLDAVAADDAPGRDRMTDEIAVRLADVAGLPDVAARHSLAAGRRALAVGTVTTGVEFLNRAARPDGDPAIAGQARLDLVEALALAGHADRALAQGAAALRRAGPDPLQRSRIHLSMARAAVAAQQWSVAQQELTAGLLPDRRPSAAWLGLQAVVALGDGRVDLAVECATTAIDRARDTDPPGLTCECYEVLGRVARGRSLDEALGWFERAVDAAERGHLTLWRARALHELATVGQLRDLSVDDLYRARDAAVAAGAPGLLSSVEFHIAAIHGVRFEPDQALAAARRCLDEAHRLGVVRQQAWGWILIGQAHACAGRRANAAAAADEALRLAPADGEITGLALGTCRGLASLLAGDRDRAVEEFRSGIAALRSLPRVPLPPWMLWPLLALAWATPDEADQALAETDHPAIRANGAADALWLLAAAVRAGRHGDPRLAAGRLAVAQERAAQVPAAIGYWHLGRRLAAERAIADGWGEPGRWLIEAETWSAEHGLDAFAVSCRALGRRAGTPVRRRGRGSTPVPGPLAAQGVTSREADVLALIVDGLTNPQIAERLYLSPRTVKAHVESLLRKTTTTSRSQLAVIAVAHGLTGSTPHAGG